VIITRVIVKAKVVIFAAKICMTARVMSCSCSDKKLHLWEFP
jgi:hypothetical protein